MVKVYGFRLKPIKGEANVTVGKEGFDPCAKHWREAEVAKNVGGVVDIDIIEEATDVKEDNRHH